METLEDRILKEISMDEIYQHIKFIVEIGQKIAGSNEEKKFVNYVTEILKKYGVEFKVYEFEGYVSEPIEATLRITYPEEKEIPCSPYAHGASTPPEGIEGELVYVGSGGLEDYRGKDVKGKVTLAELSYAPPRPEKVRIAQEMGAIAQIQINWGLMEKRLLPMGTVKSIWGNPTPEDVQRITRIAAVGVTKSDGAYLKELLKRSNKVKVWLKTQVWKGFRSLHDIIAEVPGKEEPNRFVLVNGHYDCWGPGATDNAVGNATMLELARVFNLHKNELRRGVKFAWWSGHESGIMVGSTWYVDNFWDELNKGCIAWLNIDSIGMRG
ncbi:MAG: M28 family peptidase, partial [Ignisphaera sp.]